MKIINFLKFSLLAQFSIWPWFFLLFFSFLKIFLFYIKNFDKIFCNFWRLLPIYSYCKILSIFPMLYNTFLSPILYPVVYASHSFHPNLPLPPFTDNHHLWFVLAVSLLLFCYTLAVVLKWTLEPVEAGQPQADPTCLWCHQEGAPGASLERASILPMPQKWGLEGPGGALPSV